MRKEGGGNTKSRHNKEVGWLNLLTNKVKLKIEKKNNDLDLEIEMKLKTYQIEN